MPEEDRQLHARLELMEEELHRLRDRVRELSGNDADPPAWFNPVEFRKVLGRMTLFGQLGLMVMFGAVVLATVLPTGLRSIWLGPVPLVDFGGTANQTYGVGMGAISVGGLAIGVIACGGGAIGILAIGGGAIGIFAYGGGAVGLIAMGGGAVGYVAMGGGAYGRWVLAQRGAGLSVLALNRQDEDAAMFFRRWIPSLERAITRPMQVVMAEPVPERP